MDKTTAQHIVRETFKASFDRNRYRDFINELCNGFDESKAMPSMRVPDAFAPHVKSCQRLGTFTSSEGELADVLIVQLTERYKLERTRTALRDFVAHKLKRVESYKEAGLVAFVAPDSQSWRFSYVRMEYEHKRDPKTGKIKPEERLTPARRYSYLVGAHEQCHTAQSRFLSLLQNTSDNPTLPQIEEAFSVEPVSDEFFSEYARLFVETEASLAALVKRQRAVRDDFEAKGVKTVDFAKKLLGQIVFLYFIQKKGWLGVPKGGKWGEGPHNFMRLRADHAVAAKQCLFTDVFEPLFYNTLATERGQDAWCNAFQCRIPFLNGGLFEPLAGYDWEKTKIALPNALFTNREVATCGDVGTGILDVFDRFNFTVNEAEPMEKEVAIDPEMLGKVFEKLIEENRRRGLGAFYTPREIVHYMCQESLIAHLHRRVNCRLTQAAHGLPAPQECVSRADLSEWIHKSDQFAHYAAAIAAGTKGEHYPKPPKSVVEQASILDEELRDIRVCDPAIGSGAFPVGMMIEIVRARLALTPYFADTEERTAYHFKRRAIQHCIYGVDIDRGAVEIARLRLWLSLVVDEEDVKHIKPLPNLDFKIVPGNSLLGFPFQTLGLAVIERMKGEYFDEPDHSRKARLRVEIDQRIAKHLSQSTPALGYEVDFDFRLFFSEVFREQGGFDVVIANPPYVDSERMTVEQPELRAIYSKHFSTAKGNWDLFVVFIEQGLCQLNSGGLISYIVPNKLLGAPYAETLRKLLQQRAVLEVPDYSSVKVFKEAAVYPVVFRASMDAVDRPDPTMAVMSDLEQIMQSRTVPVDEFYSNTSWDRYFGTEIVFAVVSKIAKHAALVGQCKEVGAAATVSEAYQLKDVILESRSAAGRRSKKFVNTGTIDRYAFLWGEQPTRYIKGSYQTPVILESDLRAMNAKRLRQANAPKIIIGGMTKVLECSLDCEGEYLAGKSTTIILDDDLDQLKFLVGVLNSEIVTFWYRNYYKSLTLAGGYLRINQGEIKTIPVPIPSSSARRRIVTLVENIMSATASKSQKVSKLEAELEVEVATLYGLSSEDLLIVQQS